MKRLSIALFCSAVLVVCAPSMVSAASTLSLTVPTKQVTEGERITVDVTVTAPTQSINAVTGSIVYPESLVDVIGISKDRSVINLWTREPTVKRNKILFEGIILNPGFQGESGAVVQITFKAKRSGTVTLSFADGAVLANDGLGSNIAAALRSGSFKIAAIGSPLPSVDPTYPASSGRISALPVITDYSPRVDPAGAAYIKGKGEPNAFTKLVFTNTSFKSVGEQFIAFVQTKRRKLEAVIVKNDRQGEFEYNSPNRLVAGAYNITPYLVDTARDVEKPGLGVQLFVRDSSLVRLLVVAINALALLIPIVGLIVVIYFIPWYSFRRMRVLGKRLGLEEEKLLLTTRELGYHAVRHVEKTGEHTDPPLQVVPPLAATLLPRFPQRPFPTQEPKL